METDVKLKVRTDNLGFIADMTMMGDQISVEGVLLQALKWVREIPKDEDKPTKCLLLFLEDREGGYSTHSFSSDMKVSERVSLLRVVSHWFERILLGLT